MSLTFSKLIFQALKMCHHVSYGELQLTKISFNFKTQKSGSKTVCGFSITLILKGIMAFQNQRVHATF